MCVSQDIGFKMHLFSLYQLKGYVEDGKEKEVRETRDCCNIHHSRVKSESDKTKNKVISLLLMFESIFNFLYQLHYVVASKSLYFMDLNAESIIIQI